ncbi:IS630 family transposase [Nocardiopsis synnemataformans]|uniref:IS630 family transposase n=1 Tax=Nocardiopsis synnemataformans TaxID=61305 RepID=UPI003EBFE158
MRPPTVFAQAPTSDITHLHHELKGRWRVALRAVMVLLSLHGLPPAQIAALLDYDPATVRRWINHYNHEGIRGLADRPRTGRPRLGGPRLCARITALLRRPGPWTLMRLWRYLGRPRMSARTLYRRVRQVALWRRPKAIARGDPARAAVLAALTARMRLLPAGAVIWVEDETHLHLLPTLHATWTLRGHRPRILTPGRNRQITVLGALEVRTGTWVYRLGKRSAADFVALLEQVVAAFPTAPAIVVVCDNDSIHHARLVRQFVAAHRGLHVWFGARYSPHDNPAERVWAALKAYVANTAVSWPGRRRQVHAFFRSRSPDQLLVTAAPWTSPWFPAGYAQNFRKGA